MMLELNPDAVMRERILDLERDRMRKDLRDLIARQMVFEKQYDYFSKLPGGWGAWSHTIEENLAECHGLLGQQIKALRLKLGDE